MVVIDVMDMDPDSGYGSGYDVPRIRV